MSSTKVKDGIGKQPERIISKTKKSTEFDKKEALTKTRTKLITKKPENEEEKKRKQNTKTSQNVPKITSKTQKSVTVTKMSSSRPVTPPSSRVIKSQYFPSNKLYSNALKRDDRVTITKPAPAVKALSPRVSNTSDASSMSERPKTATLRKGSIVNNNVVGPDVPKVLKRPVKISKAPKIEVVDKIESPPEYDDDFDSYESDFEQDSTSSETDSQLSSGTTSSSETGSLGSKSAPKRVSSAGTDDEKKLDSGTYELPEPRHRQLLDNIKESIEKENANLAGEQNHLGSLSDEGFEEGKSLQFINFLGAQQKYKHRKSVELRRKRGEKLLSMINLDRSSFTLFDLAPMSYDHFIKVFGKSNTVHTSMQTGEDNLDEQVQTEIVISANKWTQFPPVLSFSENSDSDDPWSDYMCSFLGVGGDVAGNQKTEKTVNENRLKSFMTKSANLILELQAEANVKITEQITNCNLPFSNGCITYNTQRQDILKNRPLKDVSFFVNNANKILTVHGSKAGSDSIESIVCLWNLSNTEAPEMFFGIFGEITCSTFSVECPNLIFCGLNNGTLAMWNTTEELNCHKIVNNKETLLRSPSYATEINSGHYSKVVAVQAMVKTSSGANFFSAQKPSQICSLDEDGEIIIWSVICKELKRSLVVENQGQAHWSSVILTVNSKISLKSIYHKLDDFRCTDLGVSHLDSSKFYIATDNGIIIRCFESGGTTSIKEYMPDTRTKANCLEMCPFSSEHFLAGFDNGDINFYSRLIGKPLMTLSNSDEIEDKNQIQTLQWSHNRPLFFYTKTTTNTIHFWNLKVSEMSPSYSVPFKENVICMKLSPIMKSDCDVPENTYMVIALENGTFYVYMLDQEHGQQSEQDYQEEKNKFLNYISRCM